MKHYIIKNINKIYNKKYEKYIVFKNKINKYTDT